MNTTNFSSRKNILTVIRNFNAPLDVVWKAWTSPDLLDQWWAPKPWKSNTTHMEFEEGGNRIYAMIGPNGEEHWGRTDYTSIEEPFNFTGNDVFCDEDGNVDEDLPTARFAANFNEIDGKTELTMITEYESEEQLNQILEMGMKEGLAKAFDQLDEVLEGLE
jgi:uncharacterized protein YndB with AHSA1/START domain